MKKNVYASLLVIGNEILSGRTRDSNIQFIGTELGKIGIILNEVRIIPDIEQEIINNINYLRANFQYVFTTGGIGPTHDDITSSSVAKAFDLPLELHAQSAAKMKAHYGQNLNEARLKMAHIPLNAKPIETNITSAPGFEIENVFVLAGVPIIAQAMFHTIAPKLNKGDPIISRYVEALIGEGEIAKQLEEIQDNFPNIDIGSYPFFRKGKIGLSVVAKGSNKKLIDDIINKVEQIIKKKGETYSIDSDVI